MAEAQKAVPVKLEEAPKEEEKTICGIIMPISGIEGTAYSAQHWKAVWDIISEAVRGAGFEPRMVSDSDPTAIIQRNIVTNLYNDPIVVCDVSSKNPNVMFELGMRLAFDKPVVIVKDDITDYTFDIGIIQHVGYPCQLTYHSILSFIKALSEKIKATFTNFRKNPKEYGFLHHFGDLKPQALKDKDVDVAEMLMNITNKIDIIYRMERKTSDKISNESPFVDGLFQGIGMYPAFIAASETIRNAQKIKDTSLSVGSKAISNLLGGTKEDE